MLTMLTQFVNNFTRKQFENGIHLGYNILHLGKIYKVSFYGDSNFLSKHHAEYVQSQYKLREFAFNQEKATQINPYATYSSCLTSLGQGRREGGFELVAQKTAKAKGDASVYSSILLVWGLEPYNPDNSAPDVGGALVFTKIFEPRSEHDPLSKECMQYYTNRRYLQYRVFKGVVAFGQSPGGMGSAAIGSIQLNTGLRYALLPSSQWSWPNHDIISLSGCVVCHGPCVHSPAYFSYGEEKRGFLDHTIVWILNVGIVVTSYALRG